jgi:peptidyl-prolyl cis-trans isomerase SurA
MSRNALYAAAIAVALIGAPTPSARAERMIVDGVAARANDHVITVSQVQGLLAPMRQALMAKYSGAELRERLQKAYEQALDSLVDRYLILDAYEAMDKKLPEWVVERRAQELITEAFGGDRSKLLAELARDNLTYEDWKKEIGNQIAVAYLRRSRVEENVVVSPKALREAYEGGAAETKRPQKVRLRMIALKKEGAPEAVAAKRKLAADLRASAAGGADFASLAIRHSQEPRAREGGDWGWTEPRMLRKELDAALAGLKPGDVSEVVETDDTLYLLKLEERQSAGVASLAEVQDDLEQRLSREESERIYRAWVTQLRRQGYVRVFAPDDL